VEAALADALGVRRWPASWVGPWEACAPGVGGPTRPVARLILLASRRGERRAAGSDRGQAHAIRSDPLPGGDYYGTPGRLPVSGWPGASATSPTGASPSCTCASAAAAAGEDPRHGPYPSRAIWIITRQAGATLRRQLVPGSQPCHGPPRRGRAGWRGAHSPGCGRSTVIAVDSDRLYPPRSRGAGHLLPDRRRSSGPLLHGHDGFLVERSSRRADRRGTGAGDADQPTAGPRAAPAPGRARRQRAATAAASAPDAGGLLAPE